MHELLKLLDAGFVDVDALSPEELRALFETTNEKMMAVYLFVLRYNDYINSRQEYSDEEALTMLEVHLLTDICDRPGSTVTNLAATWHRSVSATSQTTRKLIDKGLVTRENSKDDAKVFFLKPTKKGLRIAAAHKRYDVVDTIKTLKRLRRTLGKDEIAVFFKGLEAFGELLRKER